MHLPTTAAMDNRQVLGQELDCAKQCRMADFLANPKLVEAVENLFATREEEEEGIQ